MRINDLLQAQFDMAHNILTRCLDDCDAATLHYVHPGGTIGSIASNYAHIVFAEDRLISQVAGAASTVYESQGWADRLGIAMPDFAYQTFEWSLGVRMDAAKFGEYFAGVQAQTKEYLRSVTEEELDRVVTAPAGDSPVGRRLNVVLYHIAQHTGEIAALKGVQGLKGLPF